MSSELISSAVGATSTSPTTTAMELDLTVTVTATDIGSLDPTDHEAKKKDPVAKIPVTCPDSTVCSVTLTRSACQLSVLFQGILEDPDCHEIHLNVQGITPKFLNEVLRWMEYHETVPVVVPKQPLSSTNLADLLPEWDAKFADRDSMDDVFEIMVHANYLQVTPLVHIMCAQVASKLKGRTPDEIMKTFNIERKPTPEEEAAIKLEFPELFKDEQATPVPNTLGVPATKV